ncbi:hypothetical protein BV898_16263 [Hypsibius exemplaris]|uniref:Secretory-abundant heat soluble protein 33020 n=1 Tax=Hypsibius exemplaris TaxID=2072580 RepID=SAHS1_HYPEX|nr:RecName: Full=Secretory-abundant heat soluble protein 33020; Short=SAHS 33020; AltName: Full=Secretory-abundant heat soluble protein d; Short=SAHS-d; AltName: Full=Tardigrade-specific intrinsically disordered protein SAHS 33020; Short=TDP SAHS 33020; Flags: Precursor [Hypsibius exemplaris]OWA51797.1 hypothetical protein BV898_16263 [Hypsibius exemplaris]
MARFLVALALFGVVAMTAASGDAPKEWSGKPWLGKFVAEVSDKSENWEAFVDALGLPDQYPRAQLKTIHSFYKQGEHYHHILSLPDKNINKDIEFTLGQEVEIKHGEHSLKIKYFEDGNKLVADVSIPAKGKSIHDVYDVQGDQLIKSYKVGDVVAKKWFKKVANPAA